jgi:hypothetical protein
MPFKKLIKSFATYADESMAMYGSLSYLLNWCDRDLQSGNEGIPA